MGVEGLMQGKAVEAEVAEWRCCVFFLGFHTAKPGRRFTPLEGTFIIVGVVH